jgi:hypothetical protein
MRKNDHLLDKQIRGFHFNPSGTLSFASSMHEKIGEIGKIIDVDRYSVRVRFADGAAWWYPIEHIVPHLVLDEPEQQDKIITNYEIY